MLKTKLHLKLLLSSVAITPITSAMIIPHATSTNNQGNRPNNTQDVTSEDEAKEEKTCAICFDDKNAQEFAQLHCGHEFCTDCLSEQLNTALGGQNTTALRCPEPKCGEQMTPADVTLFANNQQYHQYCNITTQEVLVVDQQFRQCPTPDCKGGVINEIQNNEFTPYVCGACKQDYCANCLVPTQFHGDQRGEPIGCEQARREHELRTNPEAANNNWIQENTKPCPRCNVNIEKNGGCNHMTCTNAACRHHFCWVCLRDWNGHGGGFYDCQYGAPQQPVQLAANIQPRPVNPLPAIIAAQPIVPQVPIVQRPQPQPGLPTLSQDLRRKAAIGTAFVVGSVGLYKLYKYLFRDKNKKEQVKPTPFINAKREKKEETKHNPGIISKTYSYVSAKVSSGIQTLKNLFSFRKQKAEKDTNW